MLLFSIQENVYSKVKLNENRNQRALFNIKYWYIVRIKSVLIHKYQQKSTRVNPSPTRINTNQHESDTSQLESTEVQHESTQVNTSLARINRNQHESNTRQHESKTSLDHEK